MKTLKSLIWGYFALLLFEGAMRKWLLPQLSDLLLIIRDPVVLLIYGQAFRLGKFPNHAWLMVIGAVAFGSLVAGLLAELVNPWVMAFGFRTNFLHLPLLFVLPQVFDESDVKQMGTAFLLLAAPMALLMALQFRAGPQDWLNTGAGGGGQIGSAMGKIRPAGTFSFISGPVFFFAAVAAFVMFGQMTKGSFPLWLSAVAGGSTMVACAVAGSRSMLAAIAVVLASLVAGLALFPRAAAGLIRLVVVMALLLAFVGGTEIFREGHTVMSARIENAGGSEGGLGGFLERFARDFTAPVDQIENAPLFGKGFGLGTNGGAALIGVRDRFLLAEGEWTRALMESGPIVGMAFILLRTLLTLHLGFLALASARYGQLLPLLLLGVAGLGLMNGQWGQPTTQGFSIFLGSLCLASMRRREAPQPAVEPLAERPVLDPALSAFAQARSKPDALQPGRFAVRG